MEAVGRVGLFGTKGNSQLGARIMKEVNISPAGMRIMHLLIGNPAQSVASLIKATGVTRTAVTEQLNELIAGGFVERATERLPGRGRPRHIYSATENAMLLLGGNQRLVVPAIWKAIHEIGGKRLIRDVVKRASVTVAEHYKKRINGRTPAERLRELIAILREEGALVEVSELEKGRLVIRKRSCAFVSMFEESRAVCWLDQEVMSDVLGASLRRIASRHDGEPCCKFELFSSNGS